VIPQIVNAVLSRHNFILLGLRGQAKTRIIRMLTALLDERLPYVAGCEIRDNPFQPICRRCRDLVAEQGDKTHIAWLDRDRRYVEKLATPDVTIADMIGDIDPIKAARGGHELSNEMTVHYGLLPRANRGIFAINELPDLAGKIQVGLFNIMHAGLHGQSRGLHRARQNHHAAQGSHRQRDSHPLSADHRARPYDHQAGILGGT
jgi:magnesium chelatase subunit I